MQNFYMLTSGSDLQRLASMFAARTDGRLSRFVLSIFLALVPLYGRAWTPAPCELLLARGARKPQVDQRPESRMLDAQSRETFLKYMKAPTPDQRDAIFLQAAPQQSGPPAAALARAATKYIVSRTDWTPFQKAVMWEAFALDLAEFPGLVFASDYHYATDGSHLFIGAGGEAIIFRPDGKILRSNMFFLIRGQVWEADYESLKNDVNNLRIINP